MLNIIKSPLYTNIEEVAEAYFVKLIDVDKNETVTIDEGQHIEIAEPAHFKLEQQ